MREVDAHGLRRDLVVADGLECASVSRIHEQQNDGDEQANQNQVRACAAKIGVALEKVRAVRERAQCVPLEECAHDLGKAQRRDGQIVGLQTKHRQTDQVRNERRNEAADHERHDHTDHGAHVLPQNTGENFGKRELHNAAVKVLIHARALVDGDAQNGIGVCAKKHEARLTEGKQTRKAVEQVHGDCHERIHGRFFDDFNCNMVARKLCVEIERDG